MSSVPQIELMLLPVLVKMDTSMMDLVQHVKHVLEDVLLVTHVMLVLLVPLVE